MMRFFVAVCFLFASFRVVAQFTPDLITVINSAEDELNPVLSPDGKTLFFTVANHQANVGGKRDPGDIWFSKWLGGQWTAPIHAGSVLNDRAYNAVAGFSADGSQLFLLGHYDPSGNVARTQGISVARSTNGSWSTPQNIQIPFFLDRSGRLSGFVSADGKVFVFSAETYGSIGVEDLYVSVKSDAGWSEPRNLGSRINTQFQELSPSISADGTTLYFASNGRKGQGSFDIFSARRLDDGWLNWGEPENLTTYNTEGRELYLRLYPQFSAAFYTSTKNSDGYGDIKVIGNLSRPVRDTTATVKYALDTVVKIVEVKHEDKADGKQVKIYGKVTNSKTGEPVNALVIFEGPSQQNLKTNTSAGTYILNVPSTRQYTIKIEAPGFLSGFEKLDINTYEMKDLEMNFSLQPIELGATINLKSVLFVQTKTDLLPESYDELNLVVDFLKQNPNVRIELAGHTDNRGVHADNVRLSQARVNKVKEYLVSKGVDGKRITGKGYGGVKPIASNDTEESRRMNRRVEFTIKKL